MIVRDSGVVELLKREPEERVGDHRRMGTRV